MKQPKTLYLVDDDNDDLDFFCEAISLIDDTIICVRATDSDDALKSFKSYDVPLPDFIFLDLNMPLVDGRRFLAEIKMLPPYAHIPVIIYSTSSHSKDIEETGRLGASGFLSKPYSLDELVHQLSTILSSDFHRMKFPAMMK